MYYTVIKYRAFLRPFLDDTCFKVSFTAGAWLGFCPSAVISETVSSSVLLIKFRLSKGALDFSIFSSVCLEISKTKRVRKIRSK